MYLTSQHVAARHLMAALGRGIPAARQYLETDRNAKAVIEKQRARQKRFYQTRSKRTLAEPESS